MSHAGKMVVLSRLFLFIGLVFIFRARIAYEDNLLHAMFYDLSLAFYGFAMGLQPEKLLKPIDITTFSDGAQSKRAVVLLFIVGHILAALALATWLIGRFTFGMNG